jgi:hypothetical protein
MVPAPYVVLRFMYIFNHAMLADQKSCIVFASRYTWTVILIHSVVDCIWNVMAHGHKPDSIFRQNGGAHLAGVSVQSTTGSRGVRISGSNAGHTMFRGSVKGTGYPLHSPVSPSLPLPCVIVCHHISTGLHLLTTQTPSCLHKYGRHEFPCGNWPISDFTLLPWADENCAILGYYAVSGIKFLLTFRDKLSVPSMNKKPTRCTIVLKSLKLYCILISLYMFWALLRPSSGAS